MYLLLIFFPFSSFFVSHIIKCFNVLNIPVYFIAAVADIEKSYQLLEKAGMNYSTEALIMAAPEQAFSTRSIEAWVFNTRQDPRCRLGQDKVMDL